MNNYFINTTTQKALARQFQAHIFRRGQEYFKENRVRNFSVSEPDGSGLIVIEAQVEGSEDYEVLIYVNSLTDEFEEFECTCPYAEEDNCKHEAAVAMMYLANRSNNVPKNKGANVLDGVIVEESPAAVKPDDLVATLTKTLQAPTISPDAIDALIARLNSLKKGSYQGGQIRKANSLKQNSRAEEEVFKPQDYYVVLEHLYGYKIELYREGSGQASVSVKQLLKNKQLTAAQRKVLEFADSQKMWFPYDQASIAGLGQLFHALKESGFAVYQDWKSPQMLITIDVVPAPLSPRLTRETITNEYSGVTRERWLLAWPDITHSVDEQVVILSDQEYLIFKIGRTFKVYPSSMALCRVLTHLYPQAEAAEPRRGRRTPINAITHLITELTSEDLLQINAIITDATKYWGLQTTLTPDFEVIKHTDAQPQLLVDYSAAEEELSIRAVIDYGCVKWEVADSIQARTQRGKSLVIWRPSGQQSGKLLMSWGERHIAYAQPQPKLEMKLFRNFYDDAPTGFSKNLKLARQGQAELFKFYREQWPYLVSKCEQQGVGIVFTRDQFNFAFVDFRADVSAALNVDTDWLAFDVACYCGPDKITIDDLRRFIKEGQSFIRQNGKLLHITNQEELKRFVLMLESFAERENNRFEGRAYHAPEVEYVFTSSPHYTARFEAGFKKFLQEAQSGQPVERVSLPTRFKKILRPYQAEGMAWFYFLRKYRFAGILADDMGLGKTIQALTLLSLENIPGKPSLVICPKTLLYNWQSEAARFTPELKVVVIDGAPEERKVLIKAATKYDVLVTSYATLQKDEERYRKAGLTFNYAVLDEAQFIKNHSTKNAQIVKKIKADYRLAMTGTPLENSVSEIWSIFDFLMPGFLGSYAAFSRRFHKPIMEQQDTQALADLRKKVQCFMLRRTKSEVLKELPAKVEQISHCHLERAQNILYQEVLSQVRTDIFNTVEQKGFNQSRLHILAALMKLRQICHHPALLLTDKNYTKFPSAKLEMFNELVEEIVANKRKVLVFSQFTGMLDILAKELDKQKIDHLYLSGKTKKRQPLVDQFNTDPAIPVFLISLKAGGTGLNLTAADNVIIFDPWWNPSVENQAVDRAHRIGQTKSVNVFRLITVGTIEEKIVALQSKKKQLFDGLVGESRQLFQKLTWDDLKQLFE